ncbi:MULTISPECIES: class I SAM-dependent methyltransferase [unclassified Curtobacterium]|uniref:class I SAM-dependent methyltransferase n=1 Tax=unclassified Curtobacterium TaxID=257496 RepID=UPI0003B699E7|nr:MULTISPECIES: class I SAM-dependent methyltransferase [unclassified Curtobacterium]
MVDLDRRLVDLYDVDNPDGPDHDFWRGLADHVGARRIVDLGCGTGILTVTLAGVDRDVLGVDPSATMLDAARRRPGGGSVSWILGDSRDVPAEPRDLALMTGNVAQHIGDAAWQRTLRDLRSVLVPGGTVAFESRNPAARAWEAWTSDGRSTRVTAAGPLEEWSEATEIAPGVVRLVASNRFVDTDETLAYSEDLRFRGHDELLRDVGAAGFEAVEVFGDWQRGPLREDSPVMVFVASAVGD